MRVLLTGAAGFFGSRAAMHLADAEVHALDRDGANRGRLEALAPRATFLACDLDAPGAIEAVVERVKPDVCVHLAWYAVPGKYLTAAENLDHLTSSVRLARTLAAHGCRRLVTAGTCFEYDTGYGLLSETTPTAPRHLYSACKLAVFEALREACKLWGVSYCHARFFYHYGPWEAPGRLVPALITPLLAGAEAPTTLGEQVRDFLHIDDVGSAIATLANGPVEGVVNVGSGIPVRVRDVALAVERACGARGRIRLGALPAREGDPPFICADTKRLRSLGWEPRFSLDEGLADTVAWYKANLR